MVSKEGAVSVGGQADIKSSVLAAIERIKQVPAGKTLIDSITDEEWASEAALAYNCNAGSDGATDDELDLVDCDELAVA